MIDIDDEDFEEMGSAVHTYKEWEEIRRQARVKLEELRKKFAEDESHKTEIVNERVNPFLEAKEILQRAMKENGRTPEDVRRDMDEAIKEYRGIKNVDLEEDDE